MPKKRDEPGTFVEMVLVLLENRFPWLGDEEEDVSGADAVQELALLYEELVAKSMQSSRAPHPAECTAR